MVVSDVFYRRYIINLVMQVHECYILYHPKTIFVYDNVIAICIHRNVIRAR